MTDLEITRLCAEAMRFEPVCSMIQPKSDKQPKYWKIGRREFPMSSYKPLHDDAQVMALMKKFPLQTILALSDHLDRYPLEDAPERAAEINRVVCECIANMEKTRHESS